MLKRIIVFNFIVGALILLIPPYEVEYKLVEPQPITQNAPKKVVTYKKRVYIPPTGEVARITQYVAKETGHSVETINKIVFYESGYSTTALHINKNNSADYGLFQINSIHIPLAIKMGLDIRKPDDNAEFAIYLIKKYGLTPWSSSKRFWNGV